MVGSTLKKKKKRKKKLPSAPPADSVLRQLLKHTGLAIKSFHETIRNVRTSLRGFPKSCSLKFPWSLFPLCLFSLLIRHLVTISSVEIGESLRKLMGPSYICEDFPMQNHMTVPDAPQANVLSKVYQRLWSWAFSLRVYRHCIRDFSIFNTPPWPEPRSVKLWGSFCLENEEIRIFSLSEYRGLRNDCFEMPSVKC